MWHKTKKTATTTDATSVVSASLRRKQILTSVEYRHYQALRVTNMVILFLFGVGIGLVGMFLYNSIYIAIGQAQFIQGIDVAAVNGTSIDFPALERVRDAWEMKRQEEPVPDVRDPFNDVPIVVDEIDLVTTSLSISTTTSPAEEQLVEPLPDSRPSGPVESSL